MKYDFGNPEHFEALSRMAYLGTLDVSGFPPAAYRYFDSLGRMYAAFKNGETDAETAKHMKARLLEDYRLANKEYEDWRAVLAAYQDAVKRTELLCTEIEKAQDVREIADKACSVIALLTGEPSFYHRQRRKIWKEETENA